VEVVEEVLVAGISCNSSKKSSDSNVISSKKKINSLSFYLYFDNKYCKTDKKFLREKLQSAWHLSEQFRLQFFLLTSLQELFLAISVIFAENPEAYMIPAWNHVCPEVVVQAGRRSRIRKFASQGKYFI
jgi:hypothetical protein